MTQKNDRVLSLYRAFNERDIEAIMTHLADGVVWANGMEGGFEEGKSAVAAYWTRQWSQVDPEVTPEATLIDGEGRVLVEVRQRVRDLDGQMLSDRTVYHQFTFEDGLIVRFDIRS